MSWYFFGGFSAYCTVPSGAGGTTRVLRDPGMVGRALERDVERDLDALLARASSPAGESPPRVPSSDGCAVWPPSRAADRPRAAESSGGGGERVVAALALDAADGMDRRQVQHVEAHARDVGQHRLARRGTCRACVRVPAERGNISYQAENPARGGSTATTSASDVEAKRRSAWRSISAVSASSSASARRLIGSPSASSRACHARSSRASAPRTRRAVSRTSIVPICSETSTSSGSVQRARS